MTDFKFDRDAVNVFRFVRRQLDAASGKVTLAYAFDDGPELLETLHIPGAPFQLPENRHEAVQRALTLLHLIAGVSYYKAAIPGEIRVDYTELDAASARLLESIYLHGLGEFAYRNGLDLSARIRFPQTAAPMSAATALDLPERALVAIGGGKDSLVSIEALRRAGQAPCVTWIGNSQLIRACAEHTGLATLNIERQIAPALFEMNRQGAWNGHIPVTAINSAIMVLAALLVGANQVVFSNERSASHGSQIEGTGEVNHQWSKGWEFEREFGAHVEAFIGQDLHYYSLLRPFSELAVARQFARSDRYDARFSSCNRNFHILGERPANRWCGVCPKCHFVFLALAPFMPKPRLTAIFGRNLLDEESQIPGFDALMEYREHKPFECVGEGRESRAAMAALAARPEWQEDAVVSRFIREIAPQLHGEDLALAPLLQAEGAHRIPPLLWERLRADFDA